MASATHPSGWFGPEKQLTGDDPSYGSTTATPHEQLTDRQRAYLATLTPTGKVVPLSQITTPSQIADYAAAGHTVSKKKAKAAPDGSALARQWVEAVYWYWFAYYNPLIPNVQRADSEADKAKRLANTVAGGGGGSSGGGRTVGPGALVTPEQPGSPALEYQGAGMGKWMLILGGLIVAGMVLGKNKKFAKLPVISLFTGGKKSRRRRRRR